jgi:Ca-activated chloride channel family protein
MRAVHGWWLLALVALIGCSESKSERAAMKTDVQGRAAARAQYESKTTATAEAPQDRMPLGGEVPEFNTEAYDRIVDNAFIRAKQNPLSTFSIDVDTASYSNVRRFLNDGQVPPKDAVRIEELVNYFTYNYQPPTNEDPFAAQVEIGPCPWNARHSLARIGLKGKEIPQERRGNTNLVFLLDVSGSMNQPNKLPLLKSSLRMLVNQLHERDRVAIVVYAGATGLVLPATTCNNQATILAALDKLEAGGSTNGGAGINLAYAIAQQNFQAEGNNRVILCTDGDFNVGVTNQGDLTRLIEEKKKQGVFLTVLGFGMGNYKDSTLEKLADKGNGNYAYIDTINEARKVLVDQLGSTLVTIAKDVKIQVDFNPAHVAAYRLIGYENRMLQNQDFHDDTKDAGEIGAGHTVTALHELVPPGAEDSLPKVDDSKYQTTGEPSEASTGDEWLTIKLRYKEPTADKSELLTFPVKGADHALADTSTDFRFAASVAAFGMLLRESEHRGDANYDLVLQLAEAGRADDKSGYRAEFLQLVKLAKALPARMAKAE